MGYGFARIEFNSFDNSVIPFKILVIFPNLQNEFKTKVLKTRFVLRSTKTFRQVILIYNVHSSLIPRYFLFNLELLKT